AHTQTDVDDASTESQPGAPPQREAGSRGKAIRRAIRAELESDAPAARARREEIRRKGGLRPVIELSHVSLAFDIPVLAAISFVAHDGETVAVVGESGTGKSTILKLILRLLVPDRGTVCIDEEDITELSFEEALKVRQKMGMVFQGAALFDSMTVFENIA